MNQNPVMIVDDEEDFRNAIIRRLKKRGLNIIAADSAETALLFMETQAIDVIVSDVKMPGMDGISLLKIIKSKFPKTEIILLTGHANASDGVSGIKEGAFDYLSKPVALDHLIVKIKQARETINRKIERQKETAFKETIKEKMIATKRLASLGTMAAGVAHEINNPLAIINEACGWMTTILSKDNMAEIPRKNDLNNALKKIEKSVMRARQITHQLLQFSRKPECIITDVNIDEIVEETIQLLKMEISTKDIQMAVKKPSKIESITSDPGQIRQIFLNLLTNAIHASQVGGTITVLINSENQGVNVDIKDTGSGIPEENLDKVFEPFYTTKSPGEGTGLGLFVIKGIVEQLKGNISLTSKCGEGTTVSVFLPCLYQLEKG
jgi:signal transduction histidine kinase